jgi:AraC-like DNA-binding protein
MTETLAAVLLRFTDRQDGESPYSTPIEGVGVMRSDRPKPPAHRLLSPALCIVAQGAKWATVGDAVLEYRAGQALVIAVDTPSVGRVVEASPGAPCLVLAIGLDLAVLRDVAGELGAQASPDDAPGRAVFVTDFQGPLSDCALRLARLLERPEALAALYPGIMREICYWLLAGPHGGDIARLALKNSPSERVVRALNTLRTRFREPVRVEELAEVAHMSAAVFYRRFKALTALAPLQYQKQLRLLEARRLMQSAGRNAEAAAFDVGYKSASQFSREYARMFGRPPKRDVSRRGESDLASAA